MPYELHKRYARHLMLHYAHQVKLLDSPMQPATISDPIISKDVEHEMEVFAFRIGIHPRMMQNPEPHVRYVVKVFEQSFREAAKEAFEHYGQKTKGQEKRR